MGLVSTRGLRYWREFWRDNVIYILILAVFALGALALDTFGWPLPLASYFKMLCAMLPVSLAVGAARLVHARRRAAHRRHMGLPPVAVEKRSPAHNRREGVPG